MLETGRLVSTKGSQKIPLSEKHRALGFAALEMKIENPRSIASMRLPLKANWDLVDFVDIAGRELEFDLESSTLDLEFWITFETGNSNIVSQKIVIEPSVEASWTTTRIPLRLFVQGDFLFKQTRAIVFSAQARREASVCIKNVRILAQV